LKIIQDEKTMTVRTFRCFNLRYTTTKKILLEMSVSIQVRPWLTGQ